MLWNSGGWNIYETYLTSGSMPHSSRNTAIGVLRDTPRVSATLVTCNTWRIYISIFSFCFFLIWTKKHKIKHTKKSENAFLDPFSVQENIFKTIIAESKYWWNLHLQIYQTPITNSLSFPFASFKELIYKCSAIIFLWYTVNMNHFRDPTIYPTRLCF